MNEMGAWRMFSDLQMADKEIEIRWIHKDANPNHKGTLISLDSYFSKSWTNRLLNGPKWVLYKACEYVCTRIKTAKTVSYHWSIEKWNGERIVINNIISCD